MESCSSLSRSVCSASETQRLDIAANEDGAAAHVLADPFPGVAEDDDAPAVHHVAGHEVCVAATQQGALLHDLAGTRPDVAVDHQLGAANTDPGDGAGVAAHHDRAVVDIVAQSPADVVVDHETRAIGESRAEVAGGSLHMNGDWIGKPHADVMACIGIDDGYVLARASVLADELVGFAYRNLG